MATGDHSGRERQRRSPIELIEEVILSSQKEGEEGFGVSIKLSQGMKFGKDFQP
jgi:hypothetical protein